MLGSRLLLRASNLYLLMLEFTCLILQVTDGEIPAANEEVMSRLASARALLELKVHCLLVADDPTLTNKKHPLVDLVDRLHVFKAWSSA